MLTINKNLTTMNSLKRFPHLLLYIGAAIRKAAATVSLKILISVLAVLLPVSAIMSQLPKAFPLPTQQQLPVAQIHAVIQSEDGFMWYATADGLCRDNGYQIDVFRPGLNDGGVMKSGNIRCLALIGENLLFGTDEGAYSLNIRTYRMERATLKENTGSYFYDMKTSQEGCVWALTDKAELRLSPELNVLSAYHIKGSDGGALYEDSLNRMWLLQWDGGIGYWDTGHHFKQLDWEGPCPNVMCGTDKNDEFWVGTWGQGIVHYNAKTQKMTPQAASLYGDFDDKCIISMVEDSRFGLLWVTTMKGLKTYKVNGRQIEEISVVTNLPRRSMIVDMLYKDWNEDIWVAGFSPTTFIVSPYLGSVRRIEAAGMSSIKGFGLLADRMVADADDWYWIWQGRSGLTLYHEGEQPQSVDKMMRMPEESLQRGFQRSKTGTGILAYDDNTVWRLKHIGTKILPAKITELRYESIIGLREEALGNIWIATENGIYIYTPVGNRLLRLHGGRVSLMGDISHDGNSCWFAEGKYVCHVTAGGIFTRMDIGEDVTGMATGEDGTVWVATRNGHVFTCNATAYEHRKDMDDSYGSTIKQIAVDRMGFVWTLTDQTVSRFSPRTNARVRWMANDPEIRVDYFSALEPENRGMGVAGAGAYCILSDIPQYAVDSVGSEPLVTTVRTDDNTYFLGSRYHVVEIPAENTSLVISLATSEHLYAGKVTFAYRIDKDGSWTTLEQGQNRVYLNRLSGGWHEVYVRATDRFGNWGNEMLCLNIMQQVEWYKSWWAKLIYVFVFIGVIVGLTLLARKLGALRTLMQMRREASLSEVRIEPTDVGKLRYDSEFTRQLIDTIEAHMSDSEYNVGRLASDMSMSRASLFRKVREMMGMSPTALIKEIRMKKAGNMLLESPDVSISDIAAKVGFSSADYFSKCFKQSFGMLPGQYRKRKVKSEE